MFPRLLRRARRSFLTKASRRHGLRARFLTAFGIAIGVLAVVPAASLAMGSPAAGIAASGTVAGTVTGSGVNQQVSVLFAGSENCGSLSGGQAYTPSSFTARWTDSAGTHTWRMDQGSDTTNGGYSSACEYFSNGAPQSLQFSGQGSLINTGAGPNPEYPITGDYEGPSSPNNPDTVSFTLSTGTETLVVSKQRPSRDQPFSCAGGNSSNACSGSLLPPGTHTFTVQTGNGGQPGTTADNACDTADSGCPITVSSPNSPNPVDGNAYNVSGQNGAWTQPASGSNWISFEPNGDEDWGLSAGDYYYTITITLPANATNASFQGSYSSDNLGTVYVNQNQVASNPNGSDSMWAYLTPIGQTPLSPGANTLEVWVHNDGGPTGLDLQGTVTYSTGTAPGS
jgi:hypothetical protein